MCISLSKYHLCCFICVLGILLNSLCSCIYKRMIVILLVICFLDVHVFICVTPCRIVHNWPQFALLRDFSGPN